MASFAEADSNVSDAIIKVFNEALKYDIEVMGVLDDTIYDYIPESLLKIKEDYPNITDEELVQMTVECNNIRFDICINRVDLLGDPAVGRRFKGTIWLQGQLHF